MSSLQVTIPPGQAYAAVSLAMSAGTLIVNQSADTVVWLGDGAGVSPGNGIPVQPQGSVTWASAGACYGVCDTGATAAVQLLVTDTVSAISDPVSLAVAVAERLASQQQPVNVQGGTLTGIAQTVTVAGIVQSELMAQVTTLATMQFTCPTTGVIPTGTYDLKISGLNKYASVLIFIDTVNSPANMNPPSTSKALQGQFLWAPGTPSGGAETVAYWHLSQLIRLTDYIQLPCLNDQLEVTFTPTAAPTIAQTYSVTILGSNLYVPRVRYSQGGGSGQSPDQLYQSLYSAAATYFDYPGSTNGRVFTNLRMNSTTGAGRMYALNVPTSQPIGSTQFPANTAVASSSPVEFPGPLSPVAIQLSLVTAGSMMISAVSESV